MRQDSIYDENASKLVKDVFPQEQINHLVNLFMCDSATMMGNNFTDDTLEMVVSFIKSEFGWLPVLYVAMAFKKGALGKLGPGRLVGSTIHRWLTETVNEYHKQIDKERIKKDFELTQEVANLHKYPLGKAIIKKIEWFKDGAYDIDDWDKVPLKELSERIKAGMDSYPEVFGIKSIKEKSYATE